jgi:hypothetical protein
LSPAEAVARETAFEQAHAFVDAAASAGGVDAYTPKSFPQPPNRGGIRVDIEVITGTAFVPDEE